MKEHCLAYTLHFVGIKSLKYKGLVGSAIKYYAISVPEMAHSIPNLENQGQNFQIFIVIQACLQWIGARN